MKVAVVILNWNGKDFLEKFLPNVVAFSPEASVIVADNASTDDSITFLQKEYPSIPILQNPSNEGFCKGYNLALQQIKAEYYILLNSDVEVTENWLCAISYLDANPEIAALQPKIKSYHNKDFFEYAGAAGGFLDCDGYPFCRGRIFETIETDDNQFEEITEISWASGACFFIRSSVFHKLGGFDEDFFAHMEEIDLCWRIWNAGHKVVYFPKSEIYHVGGGTLHKSNPQKTYLNFRNSLYLIHKNYSNGFFVIKIIKRLFLDGLAGGKFFLSGQFGDILAIIRAHFSYYKSINILNRKRKNLTKLSNKVLQKYSIVWGYYVKDKKKFNDYGIVMK